MFTYFSREIYNDLYDRYDDIHIISEYELEYRYNVNKISLDELEKYKEATKYIDD